MLGALERIRQLPGVESAAATNDPELAGNTEHSDFVIEGYKATEDENPHLENPRITPGYFETLEQPLLAGREFTEADGKDAPKVAVVNLEMAKKYFGSAQNAVGRMVGEGLKSDTTIVGVVGDTRHRDLRSMMGAAAYSRICSRAIRRECRFTCGQRRRRRRWSKRSGRQCMGWIRRWWWTGCGRWSLR